MLYSVINGEFMNKENLIKNARKEKGLSQEHVSRQLDISLRHYQNVESGKTLPNVITGLKLARILDRDPFSLFLVDNPGQSE
jgi:putative transcriptional regulator